MCVSGDLENDDFLRRRSAKKLNPNNHSQAKRCSLGEEENRISEGPFPLLHANPGKKLPRHSMRLDPCGRGGDTSFATAVYFQGNRLDDVVAVAAMTLYSWGS